MKEPAEEVMPTTERLVTLEDTRPSTGISAVRRTGAQTSAHLEIALSVDRRTRAGDPGAIAAVQRSVEDAAGKADWPL
jgi:hypothetical protein